MTVSQEVVRTSTSAGEVFAAWLERFAAHAGAGDPAGLTGLLTPDCWWRDLLALTWDLGSYQGTVKIGAMLSASLTPSSLREIEMTTEFEPRFQSDGEVVEGFFTFGTPDGDGRGVARLRNDGEGWSAWTVMTELDDLRGHERAIGHRRSKGPRHDANGDGTNWADQRAARSRYLDREPDVVVLGAGQGGLTVAANLGLMGVDTLILEKSARVGDGWRRRYHSLVLHDPVWADHLPYMPYPESWPVYCPKDKIADWFESYAEAMELNVWTSASMVDSVYDDSDGRWTLTVETADGPRVVRPRDVVLATGAAGEPRTPDFPGVFGGTVYHSSKHTDASLWKGKKAVVVGACNSGHDIAQDLCEAGAEVTLVQRSSTYIMSQQHGIPAIFGSNFVEGGPPTKFADLLASATPWPMVLELSKQGVKDLEVLDADLLASLDAVGFKRNTGPDGTGLLGYALDCGGGYYIDVGASRLIAEGRIKLAQGSGVAAYTATGLELEDGRALEADLVVLATGYSNMRETARRLFGDRVADRLPLVLGIGEDGEIGGLYRRTGHPAFWYMGGPLAWVRIYSKHLALQITAKQAGILPT